MAIETFERLQHPSGAYVEIKYNNANNRLSQFEWFIPVGWAGRARFWDRTRPEGEQLLYDRTFGSGTGSENVPGTWTVVETQDPRGETYLDYPTGVETQYNLESI